MKPQQCALCGALYLNAEAHQAWHDELAAWTDAIGEAVEERLRARFPRRSRRE